MKKVEFELELGLEEIEHEIYDVDLDQHLMDFIFFFFLLLLGLYIIRIC